MQKVDLGEGRPKVRFTFNHKDEEVKVGVRIVIRPVTRCYIDIGEDTITGLASLFHKDRFDKETGRKAALKKALKLASQRYDLSSEERGKIWDAYLTRAKADRDKVMLVKVKEIARELRNIAPEEVEGHLEEMRKVLGI